MKLRTKGLNGKQLKAIRITARRGLLAPALTDAEFNQLVAMGWFKPRGLGGFQLTAEGGMAAARVKGFGLF